LGIDAVRAHGSDVAIEVRIAEQTLSNPCTDSRALVTLDRASGEIRAERSMVSGQSLYWCDGPQDGFVTALVRGPNLSGDECAPGDVYQANFDNVPLVGVAGESDAFAIMLVYVNRSGAWSSYGLLRLVASGNDLLPMEFEPIGPFDSYRPTDLAMTDDGPVVVGRAFNTAWISTQRFHPASGVWNSAATGGAAVLTQSGFVNSGRFLDDNGSTFEADVEWLASTGITRGCNPPTNSRFCPTDPVTRGQMAAFLSRALSLDEQLDDPFSDDDGSIFEADIERLAAAGITRGCNPPDNTKFCPDAYVTRGQMAAFLHRALRNELEPGGPVEFIDDDLSGFEADIEWLGSVGVTRGCNPPVNDQFCPNSSVTRGQMAAFLHRALG
jgi:hypothetical protein